MAVAVCTTLGYHKKYPEAMKVLIMLSALPGTQAQLYRFSIGRQCHAPGSCRLANKATTPDYHVFQPELHARAIKACDQFRQHSKRFLFRATLQYRLVLNRVTPAVSFMSGVFIHEETKGLFALLQ